MVRATTAISRNLFRITLEYSKGGKINGKV